MSIKQTKKFEYTSNCQKCGKEFTQITTQSEINRNKHRKCCCRTCANSRNHSVETKRKISKGLNSYHEDLGTSRKSDNPEHHKNCSNGFVRSNGNRTKEIRQHSCVFCGKTVYAKFYKGVYCYECAEERGLCNLQMYDENGKSIPSKKRIQASKKVQQRLLDNGTHKGWASRNIISYPEKFWMEVLKNNNIDYSFNHVVKKSELGVENDNSNYFLDFLIDGNIDLEIDGKQHKYADRAESDKVRDELLSKNGYTVYRVEWNEINTEVGKQHMKEKIETFLKFIGLQKSLAQNFC
jgi:very-short-patch-repair endonuclease